ncbi:uncharacterized protein (UPF0262 family) [Litorimonas taeanensis]|uniref:Uncharacterized protein (UPF0262 family) n=1 Tax=Litorimonas taeanensis TaxID=568099 RepID=A0A420WK72_9PROT|nr:UPF0262 family protein [Litorimonas taeanensis]RKQ71339.1 uncharacterized protein (UPF0262 family) [Litorimonas taeanensis]
MVDDSHIDPAEEHYISELHIDDESLPVSSVEMQHERRVAIFDLLEDNLFRPLESSRGPYMVKLSLMDGNRLHLDVTRTNGGERGSFKISLVPFRRVIKDYFMICESYHNAIRTATSAQIEAIDMGRRGLHNEGSRMLTDSLRNMIEIDFNTSRRLFTLICALHRRN